MANSPKALRLFPRTQLENIRETEPLNRKAVYVYRSNNTLDADPVRQRLDLHGGTSAAERARRGRVAARRLDTEP